MGAVLAWLGCISRCCRAAWLTPIGWPVRQCSACGRKEAR